MLIIWAEHLKYHNVTDYIVRLVLHTDSGSFRSTDTSYLVRCFKLTDVTYQLTLVKVG